MSIMKLLSTIFKLKIQINIYIQFSDKNRVAKMKKWINVCLWLLTLLPQLESFSHCISSSLYVDNCFKEPNKPTMKIPVTSDLDMKSLS